jgi:uncharacterized protein YndB with AHSA1/START domain
MLDLHFTALIRGRSETVFELIADLAHYDRWLPGSAAFGSIQDISPLPVGVGTRYIDAGPAGTRYGEVIEYDAPRCIAFHQPMTLRGVSWLGPIDIRLRHTLEQHGEHTRLDRDLTLDMQGPVKLARPAVVAAFRKENQRMLDVLKRYVEASGDQLPE